ncbi:MAG: thiamine pyrophosphate-binding protein, partial [Actinomycetota bacterium]
MTGAHSVARALAALGVDVAHVLPGEETIALIEALRDVDIELVVCRHEQHAAFMAATRGRLLGTPGLVVTTIGPGATNAVTGLAHATLGGFPLLHLSGQKALRDNDEGRFQLLDIRAVTAPVTKGTHLVTDPIDAASVTASAARLAASPRPGAVTVVVPQDVALGEVPERPDLHVSHTSRSRAAAPAMDHAVEVVRAARRPVVLFGGGAQQLPATAAQRFIEALVAPGVALQTGHGVVPDDHDLCFRPLGMHRHDVA